MTNLSSNAIPPSNRNLESEVRELIGKYLDGTITEEEAGRLDTLLASDPKWESLLVINLRMHFLLQMKAVSIHGREANARFQIPQNGIHAELPGAEQGHYSPATEEERTLYPTIMSLLGKSLQAINAEPYDPFALDRKQKERQESETPLEKTSHSWKWNDYFLALSLVILVLLGIGIAHDLQNGNDRKATPLPFPEFHPVARFTDLVDPVWSPSGEVFREGQGLESGEIILDGGLARLEFQNGAAVILEGPTRFSIENPLSTSCPFGRLSATIPKEAVGFMVATPFGNIIDRGTEFYMDVSRERLNVETTRGRVDISESGKIATPLLAGYGQILSGSESAGPVRFKQSRFMTPLVFENQLTNYSLRMQQKEEEKLQAEYENPELFLRLDFSRGDIKTVENSARAGRALVQEAKIEHGTSCRGFYHGTKALNLNDQAAKITLNIPGEYRNLTMSFRVRIDRQKKSGNVLIASEKLNEAGGILLQISERGNLKLLITQADGTRDSFESRTVLTPSLCGTWSEIKIQINADSGQIGFYVNGMNKGGGRWDSPIPIRMGHATIGNMPQQSGVWESDRVLDGALSEFRLYNRDNK